MCNIEINTTAVIRETSWNIGTQDIIMLILLVTILTIGSIQAISVIWSYAKKEWDWHTKPIPAKISLICRGIIGLTMIFYIIWLILNPDDWQGADVWWVVFIPFVVGAGIPFIGAMLSFFGYWFIYKPIVEIFSWIKKK